MADFDLAIIGGGLTGTSIARDAAGRGLRVVLLEQYDIAFGASSAPAGLIAGDLETFERRSVLRVRADLRERNALVRVAPHLVRPAELILPLHPDDGGAWQRRTGLFLYDQLAPAPPFPPTATLDLAHHPAAAGLKRSLRTAFAYSGATVDEARLTVLNAVDAAERGASIRTGARCVRADRDEEWRLGLVDRGRRRVITARALVNATGAWVKRTAELVLRRPLSPTGLVRESRIVVRRRSDHDAVYVLRNSDRRLVFVTPRTGDFAIIGMIDRDYEGDPVLASPTAGEIAYLCNAANRYFRDQLALTDVVGVVSTVRARSPQHPGGTLVLDRMFRQAPLLTVFGADPIMFRRHAEDAMTMLAPFFAMRGAWTGVTPLAGGDLSPDMDAEVDRMRIRWPFLTEAHARRLLDAYGSRSIRMLGEAKTLADLGPVFGPDLTGTEVRYLMTEEWARCPEDVLTRRSRLALTISPDAHRALADFMSAAVDRPGKSCGHASGSG